MKPIFLFVFLALFSPSIFAEEKEPAPPAKKPLGERVKEETGKAAEKVSEKAQEVSEESISKRAEVNAQVLLNYSPFDLLIPSKIGGTAGLFTSEDASLELEFLTGALKFPFLVDDLGEMRDTRISLIRRNYVKDSNFNFFYGAAYHTFHVQVGSEILSRLTPLPHIDIIDIAALGFVTGIGSRWIFDNNITVGVDWISWSQPLVRTRKDIPVLDYITYQPDRDAVETLLKFTSYFPRFVFLKLQVGISF